MLQPDSTECFNQIMRQTSSQEFNVLFDYDVIITCNLSRIDKFLAEKNVKLNLKNLKSSNFII